LSQVILLSPLSKASQDARSPFLKADAYRLLSLLFASKQNVDSSNTTLGKKASEILRASTTQEELLACFAKSLQDEEMNKTKRVRPLLKALEKFLAFYITDFRKLETIKALVNDLGEDSDSNAVKSACSKLSGEIEAKTSEIKEQEAQKEKTAKATQPGKKNKKKKKKKR
jgi:hypothetical protein